MVSSHIPFHQKYRPSRLNELVGQEVISLTLKQALITNKIAPAYLFSGPRGTGKTSSARIFAKSLNCLSSDKPNPLPCDQCSLCNDISQGNALDIIEIDAASNTGVENIREIIERARFAPTQARWKVYVIDECHMLSAAASNALLKTIEEPPDQVVFILATTNPERVLDTIQSRCQKYDFNRISIRDIYKHLIDIADKESIIYEESAIELIAKRSNGGMRDAQSLLDQMSLLPEGITRENVSKVLGEVSEHDLINLLNSLVTNNPELLLKSCTNLYDSGNEPITILQGILHITRDLLLLLSTNKYTSIFYTSQDFYQELNNLSKRINRNKILHWHSQLKNIEYQIKTSSQPRLWLEINLSSLLEINPSKIKQSSPLNDNKEINEITPQVDNKEIKNSSPQVDNKEIKEITPQVDNKEIKNSSPLNDNKKIKEITPQADNKEIKNSSPQVDNKAVNNDESSIKLREQWSLILSKLELPSTRMLLSQQAKLLSIEKNIIEIALSPNWENMIKSRKIVIENAAKKIYGETINIKFVSENKLFEDNKNSNDKSTEKLKSEKNIADNKGASELESKKIIQENKVFTNKDDLRENRYVNVENPSPDKNSSQNLAKFFNGEIVDINE